jgi:hypothetical protein
MGDTSKDKERERDEAIARQKEKVVQEVEQHSVEDVDLQDVSGGWTISYSTIEQ